jgi:hypothetical protein
MTYERLSEHFIDSLNQLERVSVLMGQAIASGKQDNIVEAGRLVFDVRKTVVALYEMAAADNLSDGWEKAKKIQPGLAEMVALCG